MNETGVPDSLNSNAATYYALSWMIIVKFILGLPLNLSVLYIFLFRFQFWRNNCIFLFNIMVADFLLLVSLPFKAHLYQQGLRHSDNDIEYRLMLWSLFLNRGASIAFLTMVSIDRYFSVVHQGRNNFVRVLKNSPLISIIIWLSLLAIIFPSMVITFVVCNDDCDKSKEIINIFEEVVFFTQIIVSFFILVYCTVRTNNKLRQKTVGDRAKLRRAVFVVTCVVLVFSVCFLPCTLVRPVLLAVRHQGLVKAENVVVQVYDALLVFSFTELLLDPLLYSFCCSGFKDAYMSAFFPSSLCRRITSFGFDDGTPSPGMNTVPLPMVVK